MAEAKARSGMLQGNMANWKGRLDRFEQARDGWVWTIIDDKPFPVQRAWLLGEDAGERLGLEELGPLIGCGD